MNNNKKILITGITGSGGSYLGEYISEKTDSIIYGTTRSHNDINHRNLKKIKDRITLACLDLTDFVALFRFLDKERPARIFNIASIANVRQSFDNPVHTVNNNINITLNLLEAIRLLKDKEGYNPIVICCHNIPSNNMIFISKIPRGVIIWYVCKYSN